MCFQGGCKVSTAAQRTDVVGIEWQQSVLAGVEQGADLVHPLLASITLYPGFCHHIVVAALFETTAKRPLKRLQ
jgi:hypothetical protein